MVAGYDNWLLKQADEYCAGCEPKVVGVHQEPQDGEIATENVYNCENCNESDCEYWQEFNSYPEEEQEEDEEELEPEPDPNPELQAEMDEAILWGI